MGTLTCEDPGATGPGILLYLPAVTSLQDIDGSGEPGRQYGNALFRAP